jgi:hypothetical protein
MNEVSGCGLYPGPHQQHRCNKTDYGNAVWHPLHPHRTDENNSTTKDNTMTSNSLKAQGKSVMRPVLTEVSLRNS